MGTVEFLGEVKHWIARLDLRIDEAALLVHMEPQQLERMLSFPELAPTLRPMRRRRARPRARCASAR